MLGDGPFAPLENTCGEVEEGGFASYIGAENGYVGVHAVGEEIGLVRFKSTRAGKRSGEMTEESRKKGHK